MPAALRWISDLLPTNPIVVRLVASGGSRRRDLLVRGLTLGAFMLFVILALLGPGGTLKDMAQRGASAFTMMSYGQVAAICLLTPLFMAGAISQESNPRTWEILLTTPLNSAQIVIGNLAGRLFFVAAMLLATLPLCLAARIFGGVRGSSVLASLAVSSCSALFLGSVAVLLSVLRSTGKRGVFAFYATTVLALFVTGALDRAFQQRLAVGTDVVHTTLFTPLNPFLALRSALDSNAYRPWEFGIGEAGFLKRMWLGHPLGSMAVGSLVASMLLLMVATLRVRLVGSRSDSANGPLNRWLRRVNAMGQRAPRRVWHNPVAWREASLRLSLPMARAARWSLLCLGVSATIVVLLLHRSGSLGTSDTRVALGAMVLSEVVLAMLIAINASATAVSREREDGTLDILLTTPIQPGPYLAGKLRGLIVVLWPAIATPSLTLLFGALYVMVGGLGGPDVGSMETVGTSTLHVPLILPGAALAFLPSFMAFISFTVMIGLQWSVGSRGVIGSAMGASGVMVGVLGTLGLCGAVSGRDVPWLGPAFACLSPVNLALVAVNPAFAIPASLQSPDGLGMAFVAGAIAAMLGYTALSFGMHSSMRRNFMMTVRRLSGAR